ncbi:hypothetical protein U1Q18_011746, partial [Sarracenia purpurea var. burkii]
MENMSSPVFRRERGKLLNVLVVGGRLLNHFACSVFKQKWQRFMLRKRQRFIRCKFGVNL